MRTTTFRGRAGRTAAASVGLLGACLLTGCTIAVDPGASTPSAATSLPPRSTPPGSTPLTTPSVPTLSVPTPSVSFGGLPSDSAGPTQGSQTTVALPPRFPLPSGAIRRSGVRSDDEIDAVVVVRDAAAAAAFWKRALPGAGYTVVSTDSGLGMYEVRFSGNGCVGNSQIAIVGTSAAVQCDLS